MKHLTPLTATIVWGMMFVVDIFVGPAKGQENCPNKEDYEPCICSKVGEEYLVLCNKVLIKDVISIFKRNKPSILQMFSFVLSAQDGSKNGIITIPNHLLDEHVFSSCELLSPNSNYTLLIEPKAFHFSRNFTKSVFLESCDISELNFTFFTEFEKLTNLQLGHASNVHLAKWSSFPFLQNLKNLCIYNSRGLNDWKYFPPLTFGLTIFNLDGNEIENEPMDRILNWAVDHSADTLTTLVLSGNDLTSIPLQLHRFPNLDFLSIENQKKGIRSIPSNAFTFSYPVNTLNASKNDISIIEAGAFQGNFGSTKLNLSSNNLTGFEELVFKEILQQMGSDNPIHGQLLAKENPFDCESDPCHLAWLIRDNQNLLKFVSADCSNGTSFKQLNSNAFSLCPRTNSVPSTALRPNSSGQISSYRLIPLMIVSISIFDI